MLSAELLLGPFALVSGALLAPLPVVSGPLLGVLLAASVEDVFPSVLVFVSVGVSLLLCALVTEPLLAPLLLPVSEAGLGSVPSASLSLPVLLGSEGGPPPLLGPLSVARSLGGLQGMRLMGPREERPFGERVLVMRVMGVLEENSFPQMLLPLMPSWVRLFSFLGGFGWGWAWLEIMAWREGLRMSWLVEDRVPGGSLERLNRELLLALLPVFFRCGS